MVLVELHQCSFGVICHKWFGDIKPTGASRALTSAFAKNPLRVLKATATFSPLSHTRPGPFESLLDSHGAERWHEHTSHGSAGKPLRVP